ncbi:MAG: TniB family NTP-binding protein [Herminiimonas sp.]|nr:TniB family NTP-binding protein [Herminiimonas sp.]
MSDLKHLLESTRAVAARDDAERITHLRLDRWIDYPRAARVLHLLNEMYETPQRNRMPCLLIHGDSGMGKSMVIAKFRKAHPPVYDRSTGIEHHSVVAMEMPAGPSQRRFYAQLLQAINAPYRPNDRLETLEFTTIRLLTAMRPRMLFVDEIHNLLSGAPREQRAALNLLKFLSNTLRCCIVVSGTSDARMALQSDDQMVSRFRPFELARWRESDEFRGFVQAFEKTMPLRQKSNLGDRAMVLALLDATHGVTGSVAEVLTGAARAAIRLGTECITAELIRAETIPYNWTAA